jgi:hypothetical protein
MPQTSSHLDEIIKNHNRTANLKVVFLDVVRYSKRRTTTQIEVIDAFTRCLNLAIGELASDYADYAQGNQIDFFRDIAKIPTGDGAAVMFSFEGIHDIHLRFAKAFLKHSQIIRDKNLCEKFDEQGWCNCHPAFAVRIGISEGKGIIYADINGNYNVAGTVINLASRVMNLIDANQIAFTEEAYRELIDLDPNSSLSEQFKLYSHVKIKHDEKINLYQYLGSGEPYLNADAPEDLVSFLGMIEEMGRNLPSFSSISDSLTGDESAMNFNHKNLDVFFGALGRAKSAAKAKPTPPTKP